MEELLAPIRSLSLNAFSFVAFAALLCNLVCGASLWARKKNLKTLEMARY